mgnify:CR=1 FL=1
MKRLIWTLVVAIFLAGSAGSSLAVDDGGGASAGALEEGRRLCAEYGLDPLGAIASGGLIVAVAPEQAEALCARYAAEGVPCALVADLVPAAAGYTMVRGREVLPLPRFDADEITRVF